jgi:Zn-dependent M28 family amino/carboxypeptidase
VAGRYTDVASLGSLPARADHAVPVMAVSYEEGVRLEAAAARGGAVRAEIQTNVGEGAPATVLADLPGRDPSRYYLVTAHGDSDSGGPGADDNASGEAVVLELARVFSALRQAGTLPELPVTLRFAIWGSEYASARAYIAREGERLAGCLAVINFDQAGTGAERETVYAEGNDVPWNAPLLRTLEAVGRDYAGREGFWPEFVTNPTQGGTDAYAFLPREHKGIGATARQIPAITVYTAAWDEIRTLRQTPGWAGNATATDGSAQVVIDYSAVYHSSGDTPERTTEREPQNMVRAVKAVGLGVLRLSGA